MLSILGRNPFCDLWWQNMPDGVQEKFPLTIFFCISHQTYTLKKFHHTGSGFDSQCFLDAILHPKLIPGWVYFSNSVEKCGTD
jgi:hypothetical protein